MITLLVQMIGSRRSLDMDEMLEVHLQLVLEACANYY